MYFWCKSAFSTKLTIGKYGLELSKSNFFSKIIHQIFYFKTIVLTTKKCKKHHKMWCFLFYSSMGAI